MPGSIAERRSRRTRSREQKDEDEKEATEAVGFAATHDGSNVKVCHRPTALTLLFARSLLRKRHAATHTR